MKSSLTSGRRETEYPWRQSSTRSRRSQSSGFEPLHVAHVLRSDVTVVELQDTLESVTAKINESELGIVVAVEDDTPVGVLSGQDILEAVTEGIPLREQYVEDLLSGRTRTVSPDMTVLDVIDRLSQEQTQQFPVVDESESLVGVVRVEDLLSMFGERILELIELVEDKHSD